MSEAAPTPAVSGTTATRANLILQYEKLMMTHGPDSAEARAFLEQHAGDPALATLADSLRRSAGVVGHNHRVAARVHRRLRRKLVVAAVALIIVGLGIAGLLAFGLVRAWHYNQVVREKNKQDTANNELIAAKNQADKEFNALFKNNVVAQTVSVQAELGKLTDELDDALGQNGSAKQSSERIIGSIRTKLADSLLNFRPDVINLLDDPDADTRANAAAALATILRKQPKDVATLPQHAMDVLVGMLLAHNQKLSYYHSAVDALAAIGQLAIPPLLKALDPTVAGPRACGYILLALGNMGPAAADAVDRIVAVGLASPKDALADRAVAALGDIGPAARAKAETRLTEMLADATNAPLLRALCMEALGKIEAQQSPSVDVVIKVLSDDPNPELRRDAAGALGAIGNAEDRAKKTVPALLEALRSPDLGIRNKAIQSFAHVPQALARAKLLDLAQDGSATRPDALKALGWLQLKDAPAADAGAVRAAIMRGLSASDAAVFRAAADAGLHQSLHSPDVLATLTDKLTSRAGDYSARQIALNYLVKLAVDTPSVRTSVAATLYRAGKANPVLQSQVTSGLNQIWNAPGASQLVEPASRGVLPEKSDDAQFGNKYYKAVPFPGSVGQLVRVDLMSKDFDAYLYVKDPDGKSAAWDDDSGDYRNARLYFVADRPGYTVWATTYGPRETGSYTLTFRSLTAGN